MEFRPFGVDEQGEKIRDLTGMSIRATVIYLERSVARQRGQAAGLEAVQELCILLNQRIKNSVYHVTPAFLKNAWNSYSYEFTAYLYEFCERISGDSQFIFRGGMEKASPIMQVLARPFSLAQIYGMFPYFGNKFASGSIECRVVGVTARSATLAMRFSDRTLRQFGAYRRRCTFVMCQAAQGIMAAVPAQVHGLAPAMLTETSCIANDDPWCQWNITWTAEPSVGWIRRLWPVVAPVHAMAVSEPASKPRYARTTSAPPPTTGLDSSVYGAPPTVASAQAATPGLSGPMLHRSGEFSGYLGALGAAGLTSGMVRVVYPAMSLAEVFLAGLIPVLLAGTWINWRLRRESQRREALIQEQVNFVESRHEELREAYLEQEHTRVELRRSVNHLTVLHRAGLLFSSTLDRETLLQQVLETLTRDLHFDRAMISFYDPVRRVTSDVRVVGVSAEIQTLARTQETPVTDPESPEGTVLLQGKSLLIGDIQPYAARMHPQNQRLLRLLGTKSLLAVPLKTKDRILGSMIVDRTQEHSLTQDDLELVTTFAHQAAIALDNASAYQQIEELNVGLEAKVLERTKELEQADRLRSQFLSHVSHELKTPMTSIKGFLQNMVDGLTGAVNDKQQRYLSRMLENSDRLIRMIEDLLDRTRIQTGKLELVPAELDLGQCVADVVEQLRPLAQAKRQRLELGQAHVSACAGGAGKQGQAHVSACAGRAGENQQQPETPLLVWADRDRLVQIVINLVQNAMKFTPEEGGITVTVGKENHRHAGVSVRDTGPGIPPECVEKVFDPFFRVAATRTAAKGLGLGLSIVRTLVELHGGTIEARRPEAGGAEFHFTLPLRYVVEGSSAAPGAACRILVVDDDKDIRELLEDRLSAMGYVVETETDGLRALKAIGTGRFAGMILDIGLPSLDGMEVLKQIRQSDEQLPIIMVTASGAKDTAIQAITLGAQAYLLKPFNVEELQQVIASCFRVGC
jgi:signal transduction histidine kinase